MKNKIALIFGYLIIMFVGYVIGGAFYANFIHYLSIESSYYLFVPWQIISISIALYFKKEIVEKFQHKKSRKVKKDD
jgi:poly(3-hydroxyalkanoate) synthetase